MRDASPAKGKLLMRQKNLKRAARNPEEERL